jgi:hypothetical protein
MSQARLRIGFGGNDCRDRALQKDCSAVALKQADQARSSIGFVAIRIM